MLRHWDLILRTTKRVSSREIIPNAKRKMNWRTAIVLWTIVIVHGLNISGPDYGNGGKEAERYTNVRVGRCDPLNLAFTGYVG